MTLPEVFDKLEKLQDDNALLQAEIKELKKDVAHETDMGCQAHVAVGQLQAENAKLKEALLEIQDYAISPWIVKDRCEQALKGESDG